MDIIGQTPNTGDVATPQLDLFADCGGTDVVIDPSENPWLEECLECWNSPDRLTCYMRVLERDLKDALSIGGDYCASVRKDMADAIKEIKTRVLNLQEMLHEQPEQHEPC